MSQPNQRIARPKKHKNKELESTTSMNSPSVTQVSLSRYIIPYHPTNNRPATDSKKRKKNSGI